MGRKELPLLQVLDLAIGTPEVGCLNTSLVYVVLKALITHNKVQRQSFVPVYISFCPLNLFVSSLERVRCVAATKSKVPFLLSW